MPPYVTEYRGGLPPARMSGRCVSASSSDRKSTRLNSSHGYISYAVFCLKKKKTSIKHTHVFRAKTPLRFDKKATFKNTGPPAQRQRIICTSNLRPHRELARASVDPMTAA